MALGADQRCVVALISRQSLAVVALGIALVLGASRAFASRLRDVNTFDIPAYAGGVVAVVLACAGAAFVLTGRAARVDPATSPRYD